MQIAPHNLTRQTRRGQRCAVWLAVLLPLAASGCSTIQAVKYCRIKEPRRYPLSSVAVRQLPCGPDEVSYGYKATRWSEWPGWETSHAVVEGPAAGSVEEFQGTIEPVPAEEPIPAPEPPPAAPLETPAPSPSPPPPSEGEGVAIDSRGNSTELQQVSAALPADEATSRDSAKPSPGTLRKATVQMRPSKRPSKIVARTDSPRPK